MANGKSGPSADAIKTPEPIVRFVTKFETHDYVGDIYHKEKLGVNPPRDFCPYMREIVQTLRMFTALFSVLPSPHRRGR